MKERFRAIAEIISEIRFYDIDEVADIIMIHYKSWFNDEFKKDFEGDIVKRRAELSSMANKIQTERNVIECQLLTAKSKLREGESVDTAWMARANLAFRIKGREIVNIQNQLTNLKTFEKEQRVKIARSQDWVLKELYFDFLKGEYGDEKATEIRGNLFEMAQKIVSENKVKELDHK